MGPKNGTHYTAIDRPPKVILHNFGKSRTRQSERDNANINTIMRKYEKTGVLPMATREGFFADVTEMGDYQTAMENVRAAQEQFMQMPAPLRTQFDNDPAKFLDFCCNPENRDEMVEMGLLEKPPVETPPEPEAEPPAEPLQVPPAPVTEPPADP